MWTWSVWNVAPASSLSVYVGGLSGEQVSVGRRFKTSPFWPVLMRWTSNLQPPSPTQNTTLSFQLASPSLSSYNPHVSDGEIMKWKLRLNYLGHLLYICLSSGKRHGVSDQSNGTWTETCLPLKKLSVTRRRPLVRLNTMCGLLQLSRSSCFCGGWSSEALADEDPEVTLMRPPPPFFVLSCWKETRKVHYIRQEGLGPIHCPL